MAATKTFLTSFQIHAKYYGQPAFNKLNRDVDRTQRNFKQFGTSIRKIFGVGGTFLGALGAATAGYLTFRKAFDLGQASFEAAKEVRKASDVVKQANALLVREGRLASKNLNKQTEETLALADALSKAGGIDAETLAVGLAGLSRSFSSKEIKATAKGWQDWMVKIHKGAPTMEQAAESGEKLYAFIKEGKIRSLEGLEISKEQREELGKIESEEGRRIAILRMLSKETGHLVEWMKTDEGALYTMGQAAEDNLEIIGKPMVEALQNMAKSFTEVLAALKPVSEYIAAELKPRLDAMAKWFNENKELIASWAKWAVEWIFWFGDKTVVSFQDTYRQIKETYELLTNAWNENVRIFWETWEANKPKLMAIVQWIDDYIIKPIIALWQKLLDFIIPMWDRLTKPLGGAPLTPAETQAYENQLRSQPGGYGTGVSGTTEAVGPAQSQALKEERANVVAELNANPQLREKLYRVAKAEVGTGNEERLTAFMEGILTRAAGLKGGLAAALQPNYYQVLRGRSGAAFNAADKASMDKAAISAASGSNVGNYGTGNWSGAQGRGFGQAQGGYHSRTIGGEQFGVEAADAKRIAQLKLKDKQYATQNIVMRNAKAMEKADYVPPSWPGGVQYKGKSLPASTSPVGKPGASLRQMIRPMNMKGRMQGNNPMNIAMNPTINVQGVAAGSEDLVAQRIKAVVQNNAKATLAEMKKAQHEEVRGGYV